MDLFRYLLVFLMFLVSYSFYIYIYIFLCILVYIVSLKNHFEKILWEKKIFKVSEFSTRNTEIFRGDNFFAICRQYDNNGENKIGIIFVLLGKKRFSWQETRRNIGNIFENSLSVRPYPLFHISNVEQRM